MGTITWNTGVDAPGCPGEILSDDGRSILVQTDWDYPGTASSFGWSLSEVQPAKRTAYFDRFALTAYVELGNATLNQEVTGLSTTEDASGRPTYDGKVRDLGFRLILPSIGVHAEF